MERPRKYAHGLIAVPVREQASSAPPPAPFQRTTPAKPCPLSPFQRPSTHHCSCAPRVSDTAVPATAASVVAVAEFGAADGLDVFDKAFTTIFYTAAGDPWPDTLPRLNDDGSTNWPVAGFILVYTVVQVPASFRAIRVMPSRTRLHPRLHRRPGPRQLPRHPSHAESHEASSSSTPSFRSPPASKSSIWIRPS